MTDQIAAKTSSQDMARAFWAALKTADRVSVHTINALGEYDTQNFGPDAIASIAGRPHHEPH